MSTDRCEKCGAHRQYNGWTNYETWLVALWMDSDAGSNEYFRELAQDEEPGPLADALREHHREIVESMEGLSGFVLDLLTGALESVNWYEIAGNLLAELAE